MEEDNIIVSDQKEEKRLKIIKLNTYNEAYADAKVKAITETCFTFLNAVAASLLFILAGTLSEFELDNSNIMKYLTTAANITGVVFTANTLKSTFLSVRAIIRKIVFKKRALDLSSELELEQEFNEYLDQNMEKVEEQSRGIR